MGAPQAVAKTPQQVSTELLETVTRCVAKKAGPEVHAVYVFGSIGRGEARASSDVDVGVLLDHAPATIHDYPTDLKYDLEEATGREVDLVVLNNASSDLIHRVLRDGKRVLIRNNSKRIAFEIKSRNEYWDLLPYLQRIRRSKYKNTEPSE